MGGTLRTQNFKILSTPLSFKLKIAEQTCNQISSTVNFFNKNDLNSDFAIFFSTRNQYFPHIPHVASKNAFFKKS
jgi:hypothetical protein